MDLVNNTETNNEKKRKDSFVGTAQYKFFFIYIDTQHQNFYKIQ